MRYIDLTENQTTDRAMRNRARRVMRDIIARGGDEMRPGAVLFETTTRGPTPLPVVYTTTIETNLAVGTSCFTIPFIIDLRKHPSTLPPEYEFLMAFPGGRMSDVLRFFDQRFPASLEAAASAAWHVLTRYSHFLAASIKDHPDAFLHEYVHYIDFMRTATRDRSLSNITVAQHGLERYANTPEERNAYYNEIFIKLDNKPRAWFQRPFKEVVRDMLGMLQPDFSGALSAANRRRLIQRFYAVWQDRQMLIEDYNDFRNNCVPVALHLVSGVPYETIHAVCSKHGWTERGMRDSQQFWAMRELGIELKDTFNHHLIGATLAQFLGVINPNKTFLVDLRGHLTVVKNGKLVDDTQPSVRSRVHMYRQIIYPGETAEPDTRVPTTRDMFGKR